MREEGARPPLPEQFRRFAIGAERDGAWRYARICAAAAEDDELLSLTAIAPAHQQRPNILLAAVHDLLLSGIPDPLGRHYPTVACFRGDDGAGTRPPAGTDPFPDFARFCRRHRDEVARLVATRATQTNEVGRCAFLVPALATVAQRAGRPLALVDLGAAAGLNLLFDRYTYTYELERPCPVRPPSGASPVKTKTAGSPTGAPSSPVDPQPQGATITARAVGTVGTAGTAGAVGTAGTAGAVGTAGTDGGRRAGLPAPSSVHITCVVRPGDVPPTELAAVAARLGLDQRPVDPADDEAARWLLACEWPDHLERFQGVWAALELARRSPDRPPVVADDIVDGLAVTAGAMPSGAHLCLFHSWVAAYLAPDRQRALAEAVGELARTRPVSWVFAEAPYEVPGLPVPQAPAGQGIRGATALVLVEHDGRGQPSPVRLADCHPHGRWLRWYGPGGP